MDFTEHWERLREMERNEVLEKSEADMLRGRVDVEDPGGHSSSWR
jgi:hypothetical protein